MSPNSSLRLIQRVIRGFAVPQSTNILIGSQDFPSVKEFIGPHQENLRRARDMKGMFTSDPVTTSIAKNILANSGLKKSQQEYLSFFEKNIFSQPTHFVQEARSIKVKIASIDDFPKFKQQYKSGKKKSTMISIGGPAAEDQTVLATMITKIRDRLDGIIYLTRDYKESNVNHAAKQSHARHGNALNADENLTGHRLLPKIIIRSLLGISIEEALEPDFRKIDLKWTIDPKKLRIYFGNELNWLKQEYKRRNGHLTEHDINRLESLLSQEIMNIVEKETGKQISGGVERSSNDSASVHVTFTQENDEEVRHENKEFAQIGIQSKELDPEEIKFLFGDNREIYSAYKYPGDTHIKFNAHEINRQIVENAGAKWIEDHEIERILLTKNEKEVAEFAGVVTKKGEYIYADRIHFTGGYKVDYEFDKDSKARFRSGSIGRDLLNIVEDIFDLQKPLKNDITVSTGVSINAVFRKSDRIKAVIEKFGSTGEIAVTNSHWTMIAQNDDFVMVRMTGGGNTGSEEYNPAYFLNVLANTRRIFGDDLVGILSTYGCPRSINARNSTEFAKIAEGAIISYGKGGTGNTKRHSEAATALMMLGFEEEVVEYFNRFQGRDGKLIGDELKEAYKHLRDVEFLHDNTKRVNRRMGYDQKISAEEMIAIGVLIAALSYVLAKVLKEEKEEEKSLPKIQELPSNDGIESPVAFGLGSEKSQSKTR